MPYKNLEDRRLCARRKYIILRDHVLDLLGGKCVRCGIEDRSVFQVDHIIPIRKPIGRPSNIQTFQRILKGIYDFRQYQILCANCHMKKTSSEMFRK